MTSIPAMSAPRQFLVPKALCAAGFGPHSTLDDMELIATRPGPAADWARKVLARENARTLDELLGEDTRLPRGVLASMVETGGAEVVVALVNSQGETWAGKGGWVASGGPIPPDDTIELDDNDVAFIARALREGSDGVVMRPCIPLAFVSAAVDSPHAAPPEPVELPDKSHVVAIVDPLDKDAVLEMLAVSPGPHVYRRHDGSWFEDPRWVKVLASVKPPTMVKLTDEQIGTVTPQVDAATDGIEFVPFEDNDRSMYMPVRASAYLEELEAEADQQAINLNMALLAVAGREISPKDMANTEKLRRYWLYGKGAAKIRWFTPGSWRRCYRHLVKYLGPRMTPGYCTNLSQRLGGPGVATHVGKAKPIPGPG